MLFFQRLLSFFGKFFLLFLAIRRWRFLALRGEGLGYGRLGSEATIVCDVCHTAVGMLSDEADGMGISLILVAYY